MKPIKETIRHLGENLRFNRREQEVLPEISRDIVRVIVHQTASNEEITSQMVTPIVLGPQNPTLPPLAFLRVNIWELKDQTAENAHEVIPPGGKIRKKDPTKDVTEADVVGQTNYEVWSELHFCAWNIKPVKNNGDSFARHFSFRHNHLDKGKPAIQKTTEYLSETNVSRFDEPGFFDPRDKIEASIRFTPLQLKQFFQDEYIGPSDETYGHLYSSLSADNAYRLRSQTESNSQADERTKQEILRRVYVDEAQNELDVVNHLLEITRARPDVAASLRTKVESIQPPTTQEEATSFLVAIRDAVTALEKAYYPGDIKQYKTHYFTPSNIAALMAHGISESQIKRRDLLIDELLTAVQHVSFRETVELTKEAGPQQPYILAQILAKRGEITRYEYEALQQVPNLRHIIDVACDVFTIDRTKSAWYENLRKALKNFQSMEPRDPARYRSICHALTDKFCNPADKRVPKIISPSRLGDLSEKANELVHHLIEPVAGIKDEKIRNHLFPDPYGSTTSEVPELILRMFNINQYDGSDLDDQGNGGYPSETEDILLTNQQYAVAERYAAVRKLLSELDIFRIDEKRKQQINRHIRPFRDAVFHVMGRKIGTVETKAGSLPLFIFKPEIIEAYKKRYRKVETKPWVVHGVDVSSMPLGIISDIREKMNQSQYRKEIERGGLESEDEESSDLFGFMFVLDDERFTRALKLQHPALRIDEKAMHEITVGWYRWVADMLFTSMDQQIINQRAQFSPSIRRYKGRVSKTLVDIIPIEEQTKGSPSSEAKWEWMKFACQLTDSTGRYTVEIQFYPGKEALGAKKTDDLPYWQKRSIERLPYRYPIVTVFFGVQKGYKEIWRQYHSANNRLEEVQQPAAG